MQSSPVLKVLPAIYTFQVESGSQPSVLLPCKTIKRTHTWTETEKFKPHHFNQNPTPPARPRALRRLTPTHSPQPTAHFFNLQPTGHSLQTTAYRPQPTDHSLQTAAYTQEYLPW
jgi:hypothetical protein